MAFESDEALWLLITRLCRNAELPLRAVVIGAGLAGLTAAHCLADGLFDEVTLLERDHVSTEHVVTEDPNVSQRTCSRERSLRAWQHAVSKAASMSVALPAVPACMLV